MTAMLRVGMSTLILAALAIGGCARDFETELCRRMLQADRDSVMSLNRVMTKFYRTGDTSVLGSLFSKRATWVDGVAIYRGAAEITANVTNTLDTDTSSAKLQMGPFTYSGNSGHAVINARLLIEGHTEPGDSTRAWLTMAVEKWPDGSWKITHAHFSSR